MRTETVSSKVRPNKQSYVDRIMGALEKLPGPYWLWISLFILLEGGILHWIAWSDRSIPVYRIDPVAFLFPAWLWAPLAIMIHLNRISRQALSRFRPLLDQTEEDLLNLETEFTTMPARAVWLSSLGWIIIYAALTVANYESYATFGYTRFLIGLTIFFGVVSFFLGSTMYYHSIRQLWLVNRTVKMIKRLNMFQLEPLYGFSRLTAQTGVSWMVMLTVTLLLYPATLSNASTIALLVFQVVLALAAFFLPLRFVNERLVAEKSKLLSEFNERLEASLSKLHDLVDKEKYSEVSSLNSALAALAAERDILQRIPTWPWSAGTLTGFLSAIGLPIILFIMQFFLEGWLSR